jgi:hypothetical protein
MSPDTESWHLLSSSGSGITCGRSSGTGSSHGDLPPARHKHSAILHDDAMWVYGGMTDLQERADFWRWDTGAMNTHTFSYPCTKLWRFTGHRIHAPCFVNCNIRWQGSGRLNALVSFCQMKVSFCSFNRKPGGSQNSSGLTLTCILAVLSIFLPLLFVLSWLSLIIHLTCGTMQRSNKFLVA